jgi:hypothetical protein
MSADDRIVNRDGPTLAPHGDSLATLSIEWQWDALAPFGHHVRSGAKSEVKTSNMRPAKPFPVQSAVLNLFTQAWNVISHTHT